MKRRYRDDAEYGRYDEKNAGNAMPAYGYARDLAKKEFTAIVGSGAVSATVTGDGKLAKLKLDPDALAPADADMLEDMICLATNNALQQAAEEKTKMMKDMTGGLPLPPGLNLPL